MDFEMEDSNDSADNVNDESDTDEIIFGEDFFEEGEEESAKSKEDSCKKGQECSECGKKFVLLTVHKNIVHQRKEPKRCYLCGQIFFRAKDLKDHLFSHKNLNIMCCVCDKKYHKSEKLILHLQNHKEVHIYACTKCPMTFATEDQYVNHMELHIKFPQFQCFFCYKIFTSRVSVKSHLFRRHPNMYKCPICKKTLRTARNLRHHVWRHKDQLPFSCAHCELKFPTKARLAYHLAHVHRRVRLQCPVCSKPFRHKFPLEAHLTSHQPDQKYKCHSCDKSFCYKVSLKDHFVETTCSVCRRPFPCRTLRFQHQDSAHKKYVCRICKHFFKNERALKYHETIAHLSQLKTELFECDVCPHATNTRHNLLRHKRRSHSTTQNSRRNLLS